MIIGWEIKWKRKYSYNYYFSDYWLIVIILGFNKFKELNFKQYDLNYEKLEKDIRFIKESWKMIKAKYIESEYDTFPSYQVKGYVVTKIYPLTN
mgnify:CR=1 FL=1